MRKLGAGVALTVGLFTVCTAPTAAAAVTTVPVRAGDLATGNLDGDGVVVTRRHGAPPGLGGAALGLVLDGRGEEATDTATDATVRDEASINVAPRRSTPLRDVGGLSYWTRLPAHTRLSPPTLQVHLTEPEGPGHLLVQFAPAGNGAHDGGPWRRWQHWDARRRGRARWRVLAMGAPATDPPSDRSRREDLVRCNLPDCIITWHDLSDRYGGWGVAEVRVVLAPDAAGRSASAGAAAAATRSSEPADAPVDAVVDGLQIGGLRYDFDDAPGRGGPHGRRRWLALVAGPLTGRTAGERSGTATP